MAINPTILTQTGVGRSSIWYPDWWETPFAIGVGCSISGTVTYNIEHFFDDPQRAIYRALNAGGGGTSIVLGNIDLGYVLVNKPVQDLTTPAAIGGAAIVSSVTSNAVVISGATTTHAVGDAISFLTWFPNSGITAATANANGNYAFPVRGISINVTAGTGTVWAELIQASAPR